MTGRSQNELVTADGVPAPGSDLLLRDSAPEPPANETPARERVASPGRRVLLKRTAALAAGAIGFYTWRIEPHWVELVHRSMPIRNLPRDLEGRTLVQLSDIHVGPRVEDEYLLDTFAKVTALRPDFVAITGDFVSYFGPEHLTQLARIIAHVPHGRLATAAILGNHDYGHNWSELDVADRVTGIVSREGVRVLRNEARVMAGLQIVGVDDYWSPRFNVEQALADRDRAAATVVLCHNPDAADDPRWGDYEGWILSGHTHGGQCRPPFLPAPIVPVKNRRYTAGEFELIGNRRMYINRAIGHLYRIRFNVRPEVTIFHLTRA
jgi:uncharacterized protein